MLKSKYFLLWTMLVGFADPVFSGSIFDELRLVDVQASIGGHQFVIRGNGEYEILIVKPSRSGKINTEYFGQLSKIELRRVNRALRASRFKSIRLYQNKTKNSDVGPIIKIRYNGKTMSRQKLSGDKHRRFDELYGTLLALISELGKKQRLQSTDLDVPVLP